MHESQMPHEPAFGEPTDEPTDLENLDLLDMWRVWVTPSDRKRCTYVTRDERPLAAAGHTNRITRL